MFCGLGRFGVGTFCSWDVSELGPFVLGRFVLGRFVLGRFVGAPKELLPTVYGSLSPCMQDLTQRYASLPSLKTLEALLYLRCVHINVKLTP
jgi:hypothetical protein